MLQHPTDTMSTREALRHLIEFPHLVREAQLLAPEGGVLFTLQFVRLWELSERFEAIKRRRPPPIVNGRPDYLPTLLTLAHEMGEDPGALLMELMGQATPTKGGA